MPRPTPPADDASRPPGAAETRLQGEPPVREVSSEEERARALAEVLRHQAEHARARRLAVKPPRPFLYRFVPFALSTALAIYVWFGSPAWLQPDPIPEPTLQEERSTLRLVMFLQAQRIELYRRTTGRLPAFLEEAGPPLPGIVYRRLDARTYRLYGHTRRQGLVYTSTEPLTEFLDTGEDLLALELDS